MWSFIAYVPILKTELRADNPLAKDLHYEIFNEEGSLDKPGDI
jgi:hypothetical protein